MQAADVVSKEALAEHNCSECAVLTADVEIVCIRCGAIDPEETARVRREMIAEEAEMFTATDHNKGDSLYGSASVQQGYVSKANPGVAFSLNDWKGKDAHGHRIKPQLVNAYKTGLIADESRGCHTEQDPLTGKVEVKFSRYDTPILQWLKSKAAERCTAAGLDPVGQTQVAMELKRICSHLVMTAVTDFAVAAALFKYQHYLPASDREQIARELTNSIEAIRKEVVKTLQPKP